MKRDDHKEALTINNALWIANPATRLSYKEKEYINSLGDD